MKGIGIHPTCASLQHFSCDFTYDCVVREMWEVISLGSSFDSFAH